jgi:hypothetical protein
MDLFAISAPQTAISDATPVKAGELDHMERRVRTRGEQLGAALDRITERFGSDAVVKGGRSVEKITASDKIKLGDLDQRDLKSDS